MTGKNKFQNLFFVGLQYGYFFVYIVVQLTFSQQVYSYLWLSLPHCPVCSQTAKKNMIPALNGATGQLVEIANRDCVGLTVCSRGESSP